MFYFFDCEADGGPTAVVPRSHRLPETPEQTIAQVRRALQLRQDGTKEMINPV